LFNTAKILKGNNKGETRHPCWPFYYASTRHPFITRHKSLYQQLGFKHLTSFLFLGLTLGGIDTDLLVVFLKSSQIFSGLGEFTFFHTLTDVPVNEGSLGVHKIEFVVKSGEDLSNGSGVGNHTDGSHDLGKVTTWNDGGWLVIDSAFETSWAPVDELNGSLGLDGGNGGIDIFWDNITSVHQTTSHVFSVSWVTLHHHGGWLEDGVGDFSNGQLLVVSFLSGDDWGER